MPRASIGRRDDLPLAPPITFDGQIHIIDPANYPLDPDATYDTGEATVDDMRRFFGSMGIGRTVIVQPSVYGFNNTLMLKSLAELGKDYARGIAVYDPANTTADTLREWHVLGVRGARINLRTTGITLTKDELNSTIWQYIDSFQEAGLDWHLQFAVDSTYLGWLEEFIPATNVRIILDHFGYPTLPNGTLTDPYTQIPGFSSTVNLIKQGQTYLRLSGPYRITDNWSLLDPIGKELVRVGGRNRLVWASDWPHVKFEDTDIRPFITQVVGWCGGDESLVKRIFAENLKDLFKVGSCE
ncbi:amidohydrolase 2 [Thozetella sp. PMI_491]|nr:amidohydrolase 2 [Thozetella sp. PMI_491]